MRVALVEERLIGIAHELGLCFPSHDLKIHRLYGVVGITVDHTRRTGDAVPRPQGHLETPTVLFFEEYGEVTLQFDLSIWDPVADRIR